MSTATRLLITEVHNYGGFFGGDTVTLDAAPVSDPDDWRTLVIDARALDNVPERHRLLAGMVLDLEMDGERVDRARLLAAPTHEELRGALGPAAVEGPLSEPLLLSGRCPRCERWVLAELLGADGCAICQA